MQRHSSRRISANLVTTLVLFLVSSVGLLAYPAYLTAQSGISAGSSSLITKNVLESRCEKGYLYEIQAAPKDSKEPFVIKQSPNPDDPEKRWSGVVKYRRPPVTPGGKATIMTLPCTDKVAEMIELTRDVSNLGSGPKVSYSDFAVDFPLDPRNPDQLNSVFTPPAKDTGTVVAPAGSGDKTPLVAGEVPPAEPAVPPANTGLYDRNNQTTIYPSKDPLESSAECPTCGAELKDSRSAAATPAGAPSPETVRDLNSRISNVATAALEKHPDVVALGGVDVVKACVAAQNCHEVVPKTKGIESFFATGDTVNGKYSKIVADATFNAIKSQPGLGSVTRPNEEITRTMKLAETGSGDSWRGEKNWTSLAFNNLDPVRPLYMWTDKMQAANKTPSDIVVYKGDGSSVPVRLGGELVDPGGSIPRVEDRITSQKTFDTFFSAMVGTNKSESDRANFKLTDPTSPVGERTVTVVNNDRVQLATLPEQAYSALQNWGDKMYKNDFQDQLKRASADRLSFAPSDAFPKDIGFDEKFAPASGLTPLTPDRRYEKQEALLAAAQRYTPEYWASLREPAVIADFGKIPNDSRVKAGAYTYLQPGNQIVWINGNYKTEWLGQAFDHETLHLVEGPKRNNRFYPTDRDWGETMFGEQYGKVYAAESGVSSIASAGGYVNCTEYDRPEGFPSCYAYSGGPMEHKAEMQTLVMGNYNLAYQEAQKNPFFKKGFDLIVQSLYKASNGTMTQEYLASLRPSLPYTTLPKINIPLTTRIFMNIRK